MTVRRALLQRFAFLSGSTLRSRFFFWNMFGNIAPLFFALAAVPYVFGHSSKEYVGFLTITWAAIGYTGIFDFGISRALFYFAAFSKSKIEYDLTGAIVKSSLFAVGISILINLALLAFQNQLSKSMMIEDRDQLDAILIIAASLPIYLISNMVRSSMEGLELFKDANIFKFISYSSLFVCPAALIAIGDYRLSHVCLFYAAVRLASCLYAVWTLRPHLAARRRAPPTRTPIPIGSILRFGGWATVSSTVSPLMVYGDRFVLAHFNGASAIAIYALLQEFIGKTILFSASYVASIQPKLGYLPEREAAQLYHREHKNIAILSVIIYAGCLLASPLFAAVWLNVSVREVAFLAVAMSVGFMFNSMAQAPLSYLLARGHPRRIAYSHMMEALFYFPLLFGAAYKYGVLGAAIAGVLRQVFDYGILSWQARRPTA